jgi:DNA-nicking Smr family endonuclease
MAAFCRRFSAPRAADRPAPDKEPPDTADDFPAPVVITDDLDLHGFFPEQVPDLLDEFLRAAEERGISEVRIAHGKGKSVLRRVVWEVLAKHPLVIDFRQAPPERGGWGATIARVSPRDPAPSR